VGDRNSGATEIRVKRAVAPVRARASGPRSQVDRVVGRAASKFPLRRRRHGIENRGVSMPKSSCPECGGATYRLLAPGFRECTSTVEREWFTEEPDLNIVLAPNAYGRRTVRHVSVETCGHRYQVAPADSEVAATESRTCRCGLFAIGICQTCRTPVCGSHHVMRADSVLCRWCIAEEERPEREARQAEARAAQNRHEVHLAHLRELHEQLLALPAAGEAQLVEFLRERGRVNPAEWSLASGARIEPVPWDVAARALQRAGVPTYEHSWTSWVKRNPRSNKNPWDKVQKTFVRSGWIASGVRRQVTDSEARNVGEVTTGARYLLGIDGVLVDGTGDPVSSPPVADLQALVYLSKYGSNEDIFPAPGGFFQADPNAPDGCYFGLNSPYNRAAPEWLRLVYGREPTR
jgi:hypothetical protein